MSLSNSNSPVLPVCLCISTNSAMGNTVPGGTETGTTRIALVQSAIENFLGICAGGGLPYQVAVSILIFDDVVTPIRDFEIITPRNAAIPVLKQDRPYTAVGEVMNKAMDLMDHYAQRCADDGISCLPPVLLLLYAGKRNHGTSQALAQASARFTHMQTHKGLQAALLGITAAASLDILRQAAPGAEVARVDPWSLKKGIPALIKTMGNTAMCWKPQAAGDPPKPKQDAAKSNTAPQQASPASGDTKHCSGHTEQPKSDPAQPPFITSVWDI